MTEFKEQFNEAKHNECDFSTSSINPDVISVNPQLNLKAEFGGKEFQMGDTLSVSGTQHAPRLYWKATTGNDLFTVIMADPDAPSRSKPAMRNYLHWLVHNVPASTMISQGQSAMQYMGPAPPKECGPHRYVLMVFKQMQMIDKIQSMGDSDRKKFNVEKFLEQHEKQIDRIPLAGTFFLAENK